MDTKKIKSDNKGARYMGKYEAQERYDKENTFKITLKLNRKTETDLIEKLNSVERKQTYIKGLIRADIAKTDK